MMFKTIKNKIKNTGVFGHSSYGKTWQNKEGNEQNDWYRIFITNEVNPDEKLDFQLLQKNFFKFRIN